MSSFTTPPAASEVLSVLGGNGLAPGLVLLDAQSVTNASGVATNVTAIALKAPIASPTFTGTVTIPTPFTIGAVSMTATGTELNILDGVTSTTAELNILDGVTSTAAELNILDGVTADKDEINFLDGSTAGTAVASKALVVDASKDLTLGTGDITATDITASNSLITDTLVASTADTPITVSNGTVNTPATYTPDAAGTATLDVSNSNIHAITMPAGNITIAISNETVGQVFLVEITQDGTGSRTVTWFSTIKWSGGSAPTLTTTADKKDTFGFRVTGADTYDGYIVGQNI